MPEPVPFRLRNHPWAEPNPHAGVLPGAADGWMLPEKNWALLFHTTTETNAAAILRDGFRPSPALKVGGSPLSWGQAPGREMPPGIWTSIRPTLPDDRDIWMPAICQEPWAVLQISVPFGVLADRCVLEHTWPVAQFCLRPEDVLETCLLEPEEMPWLLHPEAAQKIASFVREALEAGEEDYHQPSPYVEALLEALMGIEASQAVEMEEAAL